MLDNVNDSTAIVSIVVIPFPARGDQFLFNDEMMEYNTPRHPLDTEDGFISFISSDVRLGFHAYTDDELTYILNTKCSDICWTNLELAFLFTESL